MVDKVKQILSEILEVEDAEMDSSFSSKTYPKWDSMKHMKIVLELENRFDVEFEENEIIELREFEKIIKLLKEKNAS